MTTLLTPIKQTAKAEVTLPARIKELITQHGSLRAASRVLMIDAGYLSRLASGEKSNPNNLILSRMGLHCTITYERVKP